MISQSLKFIFESVEWNQNTSSIICKYKLESDSNEIKNFVEKIYLPENFKIPISVNKKNLFFQLLTDIHLILGISYWKLYCPSKIKIKSCSLSKKQSEFWNKVYTTGLGEFYFRNNILPIPEVSFPFEENLIENTIKLDLNESAIVAIGGGKDSIVSIEMLKKI